MSLRRSVQGALFAFAFLMVTDVHAALFVVPADKSLVKRADAIVTATVVSSHSQLSDEGGIETETQMLVGEVIKGRFDKTVTVVEPGGEYAGKATLIAGVPQFAPGEELLLFLKSTGRDRWAVADLVVGEFEFRNDVSGRRLLVREEDELNGWDPNLSPHVERRRAADAFLQFVRDEARGRPSDEDYFVETRPLRTRATSASTNSTPIARTMIAPYSATSYTMTISGTAGSRWAVFPNPVTFYSGTTQEPGAPGGGTTAINAAFSSWNNDCGSNVNYFYGGTDNGSHTQGLHGSDGANTILFERDLSSWGISPFTCSSSGYGGTLGLGGVTVASGSNVVNGETFATTSEADVEMNKGIANCTLLFNNGDFNTAVTHEVGHTLGFRHADQDRSSSGSCSTDTTLECSQQAVMKSFISTGINAALQPWDQHAVQAVYPGNVCSPNANCTLPLIQTQPQSTTVSSGSSVTLSVSATGTSLTYQWYHGSSGDTSSPVTGATSPSLTYTASGTGTYWVRVSNACGSVNSNTVTVTVTASTGTTSVALQRTKPDFNGDGRADILWRNFSTGSNYMYLMNGISTLSSGQINTVTDQNWQIAGTGDFNGDGRWDILWRNNATGENYMYLMNGMTILSAGSVNTVQDLNWHIVGTGDFNGDGRTDILWRNNSTGAVYVYLMNGMSITAQGQINSLSSAWQVGGTGDFNGDGRTDILWRNTSTGENFLYFMNGLTYQGAGINSVASPWTIAGTGDFDGDGRTDILWRNTTTGENYLYLMNGASILSSGTLNSIATTWTVAGTGDYNGDGRSDILWRNTSTGDVFMYLMNGFTIQNAGTVNVVDTSWHIVQ